jgi:DMSO/TMAO reductase YedYZ molybdopterin-dependent catalytic subunit
LKPIKKRYFYIFILISFVGTSLIILGFNLSVLNVNLTDFPDFITKTEDYFQTRISAVPEINGDTYELEVFGEIENPRRFNLDELYKLDMMEIPLTTECIGNGVNGNLISTAYWKGFNVYNFLKTLGIKENATGVKYYAADNYFASHTLNQIENNSIIGALYINGEILPPAQGFPLRVVSPGAYGAKQPAWVTRIEVIDGQLEDFWDNYNWDTSPPMDVDSKIFFPSLSVIQLKINNTLTIGGAAFGGTRIDKVEYTLDRGETWFLAEIVQSIDYDHVWVFWKVELVFNAVGPVFFNSKATDIYNNSQPHLDYHTRDGTNSWPTLTIEVVA